MAERLQSLVKNFELEEQRALEEERRIDAIVDVREQAAEELRTQHRELQRQIAVLSSEERPAAMREGDTARVTAIAAYSRRLRAELEGIGPRLVECEAELERARERLRFAREEVVQARVERKKIEKIIENRQNVTRSREAAEEELSSEEVAEILRRRG